MWYARMTGSRRAADPKAQPHGSSTEARIARARPAQAGGAREGWCGPARDPGLKIKRIKKKEIEKKKKKKKKYFFSL